MSALDVGDTGEDANLDTDEVGYPKDSEHVSEEAAAVFARAEAKAKETGRVLVIANVSKSQNIDQLLLLAIAHDFVPVVVHSLKTSTAYLLRHGEIFFRLYSMEDLHIWLKENDIPLMGIEIMDTAISVNDKPFARRMALMPGNEGTGLSIAQKQACDGYVIIPHYGDATASLNVHVATCVVLYRYCDWLQSLAA
jgi:tRNA G18 (ribose-2'-O)-methylase SpoU